MENNTITIINKTREYLDYVERHIRNVQAAWIAVQEKCSDMPFMNDDYIKDIVESDVKNHDISKLSQAELVPYRVRFYPAEWEAKNRSDFKAAWDHHLEHNKHHWQSWTTTKNVSQEYLTARAITNALDWIAMGMEFKDNAREYYTKHKDSMTGIPEWADTLFNQIFDRVYGS